MVYFLYQIKRGQQLNRYIANVSPFVSGSHALLLMVPLSVITVFCFGFIILQTAAHSKPQSPMSRESGSNLLTTQADLPNLSITSKPALQLVTTTSHESSSSSLDNITASTKTATPQASNTAAKSAASANPQSTASSQQLSAPNLQTLTRDVVQSVQTLR
jgi:hypothetical protein